MGDSMFTYDKKARTAELRSKLEAMQAKQSLALPASTTFHEVFSSAITSALRSKRAMGRNFQSRTGRSMVEEEEATFDEVLAYEGNSMSALFGFSQAPSQASVLMGLPLPTSNSSPIPTSSSGPLPMQRVFSTNRMGPPPHPFSSSSGDALPGSQPSKGHQVVVIQPGGNSRAQWMSSNGGGGSLQGSGLSLTGRASLAEAGLLPSAGNSHSQISGAGHSYHTQSHHHHQHQQQQEDPFPLPGAGASGGLKTRFSLVGGGSDDEESESSDGYEGSQDVTPRLSTRISMAEGHGLPGGGPSKSHGLQQGGGTLSRRQSAVGDGSSGGGGLKSALAGPGRPLSRQTSRVSMSGIDWTSGTSPHGHHGSGQHHHHSSGSEDEANGKTRADRALLQLWAMDVREAATDLTVRVAERLARHAASRPMSRSGPLLSSLGSHWGNWGGGPGARFKQGSPPGTATGSSRQYSPPGTAPSAFGSNSTGSRLGTASTGLRAGSRQSGRSPSRKGSSRGRRRSPSRPGTAGAVLEEQPPGSAFVRHAYHKAQLRRAHLRAAKDGLLGVDIKALPFVPSVVHNPEALLQAQEEGGASDGAVLSEDEESAELLLLALAAPSGKRSMLEGAPLPLGDPSKGGGPVSTAAVNPLGRSLPSYPATVMMGLPVNSLHNMEHTPSVTEVVSSRMWHPDPGRLQAEKGTAKAVRAQAQAAIKQRVQELTERRERERLRKASALGERSAYSAYRSRMASRMVSRMPSATRRDGSAIGASASTATAQQQQQQQLEQAVQQLHGKLSENGMGGTGEGSTPVRRTPLHHHEPQFEPEHIVHHGSSPYSIDANGKRVFHARKNSGNKSPKSPPGNKVLKGWQNSATGVDSRLLDRMLQLKPTNSVPEPPLPIRQSALRDQTYSNANTTPERAKQPPSPPQQQQREAQDTVQSQQL